jgi:predicted small metal-binding protein
MGKVIDCKDVGVECDFTAHGETEEEVIQKCAEHAQSDHGMKELPQGMVEKVRAAIRNE